MSIKFRLWQLKEDEDKDINAYLDAIGRVCDILDERTSFVGGDVNNLDSIAKIARELVIHVTDTVNGFNPSKYDVYGSGNSSYDIESHYYEEKHHDKLLPIRDYAQTKQTHTEIKKLTEILENTIKCLSAESKEDQKKYADACVTSTNKLRIEPIKSTVLFIPRAVVVALLVFVIPLVSIIRGEEKNRVPWNTYNSMLYYMFATSGRDYAQKAKDSAKELQTQVDAVNTPASELQLGQKENNSADNGSLLEPSMMTLK